MYKISSSFIIIAALLFCACKVSKKQQKVEQPKVAQINTSTGSNTLLWKVTGNGLDKPSYIYGTMHLLCANDAALSDSIKQILQDVDKIYFELDMDDLGMMLGAITKMNMKGDTTLKTLLSLKDYTRVKEFFTKKGGMIPFTMLERMQPMLTSSTLAEEEMDCDGGVSGIEMQMMEFNKKNAKKEILGLETIEQQLNAFSSISYKEQATMLLKYLDSMADTKNATKELVKAYKSQNLDTIANLMLKSEPEMEKHMDVLLLNRNKNWIVQFKKIFAEKSIIAAVGAGHLVGESGVLNLLRKEGYTVSPVKN